jgi:hypothetical protein
LGHLTISRRSETIIIITGGHAPSLAPCLNTQPRRAAPTFTASLTAPEPRGRSDTSPHPPSPCLHVAEEGSNRESPAYEEPGPVILIAASNPWSQHPPDDEVWRRRRARVKSRHLLADIRTCRVRSEHDVYLHTRYSTCVNFGALCETTRGGTINPPPQKKPGTAFPPHLNHICSSPPTSQSHKILRI